MTPQHEPGDPGGASESQQRKPGATKASGASETRKRKPGGGTSPSDVSEAQQRKPGKAEPSVASPTPQRSPADPLTALQGALGLAARAGKMISGAHPVLQGLLHNKAQLIVFGAGIGTASMRKFTWEAERHNISSVHLPMDVGTCVGKKSCVVFAITSRGMAQNIARLAEALPCVQNAELPALSTSSSANPPAHGAAPNAQPPADTSPNAESFAPGTSPNAGSREQNTSLNTPPLA